MSAISLASHRLETTAPQSRLTRTIRQLAKSSLWIEMSADANTGLNNITPPLLQEFRAVIDALHGESVNSAHMRNENGIRYAVVKSRDPEYFSLGGDLSYFRNCIDRDDAAGLYAYSKQCLDLMYSFNALVNDELTTIALVQGRALGGGFELALSADCIIAEEHSTFAFPEIMFGLFPCTGAMGLLNMHMSPKQAERFMTESKIYTARELYDLNIIDVICPTGEGERAVEEYIGNHAKRMNARLKIQASRRRIAPLDYNEGLHIVNDWVELARNLSAEELRTLDMLIMMQRAPTRRVISKAA